MSTRLRGPFTLKGAFVSIDPSTQAPSVIAFQYNPASLKRELKPEMVGGEEGDRSLAVRFKGAPVETISVEVEIDATDRLESGEATAVAMGIHPQLAALELLVYPQSATIISQENLLASGVIEIAPLIAPRTLFVWGTRRVLPVRLTSYSIAEEAFDGNLNPIRATVSVGMRVLNYSDLDSSNRGYSDFLAYQQSMEAIAGQTNTGLSDTNIGVDPNRF
jgi:hypothetical protein